MSGFFLFNKHSKLVILLTQEARAIRWTLLWGASHIFVYEADERCHIPSLTLRSCFQTEKYNLKIPNRYSGIPAVILGRVQGVGEEVCFM